MGTAAFPHPPPFCQSVFSSKRVISQAEKRRENIKVSYQNWLGIFPEILKMLETNCNRNRGISSAFLTEDKKKPISAVPAGSRKISFPQSSSTTEPPNLQLPSHPQLHGSIPSRNLQREWEIQTDQCTSQTRAIKMKREKKKEREIKKDGDQQIFSACPHTSWMGNSFGQSHTKGYAMGKQEAQRSSSLANPTQGWCSHLCPPQRVLQTHSTPTPSPYIRTSLVQSLKDS